MAARQDLLRPLAVLLVIERHLVGAVDPATRVRDCVRATWARGSGKIHPAFDLLLVVTVARFVAFGRACVNSAMIAALRGWREA